MTGASAALERALVSYNFELTAGQLKLRASKVRNIEQSLELEELREGGRNDGVHLLIKPPSGVKRLVLERCYCTEGETAVETLLGVRQAQPLLLALYDRAHKSIVKSYRVEGWMICKWQVGELNAVTGGLLLETVEIAYERLTNGG